MNLYEHRIATAEAQQMAKVTDMVRQDIVKSGIKEGIAVVYSPHTTAGLEEAFPTRTGYYRHMEGNSHAHIKTSFTGPSQTLIVHEGELVLGIWQDLYFCEFDGPRNRKFYVKIVEG